MSQQPQQHVWYSKPEYAAHRTSWRKSALRNLRRIPAQTHSLLTQCSLALLDKVIDDQLHKELTAFKGTWNSALQWLTASQVPHSGPFSLLKPSENICPSSRRTATMKSAQKSTVWVVCFLDDAAYFCRSLLPPEIRRRCVPPKSW
jgi:hypothetical protein